MEHIGAGKGTVEGTGVTGGGKDVDGAIDTTIGGVPVFGVTAEEEVVSESLYCAFCWGVNECQCSRSLAFMPSILR